MPKPALFPRSPGSALHRQIYLLVRDLIISGRYTPGQLLPSEAVLAETYGVSRVTIRAALAPLGAEGLIVKRQGIGNFVADDLPDVRVLPAQVGDLQAHMKLMRETTTARVLEFGYEAAPPAVQAIFGTRIDTIYQRAVRVRSLRGKPILYLVTFLPESIGRLFSRADLQKSAMSTLLARHKVRIASARQSIGAILADPKVAAALQVEVGAALLHVRRVHLDARGVPVEHVEMMASPTQISVQSEIGPTEL